MEEKPERLRRVVRTHGVEVSPEFLAGRAPVTVPAGTRGTILLDQTYLTTAYPELTVSGGRGAEITLTYAEALWKGNEKGNRNVTEGKVIRGYLDRFLPDGSAHRLFRPLWWRTFRYIQIDVETHQAPVFVATFPASDYVYAEVQPSRELCHWISGHVRAFAFFGGLPKILRPDNPKTGVKSPNYYEPDLNPTYQEMAEYYQLAVLPARVRKPRD